MKSYLKAVLDRLENPAHARNAVREALQSRILASLQRAGGMLALAFHGGTALRFLHGIDRYSEDLDFALERPDAGYDFRSLLRRIRSDFEKERYAMEFKVNDRKIVHSAFIRFPGLLYELGLSPRAEEKLAIKLEVDTKPPSGAILETSVVRRHLPIQLFHHDRSSLLAGKLHAILARPYTKGRDLYDLIWYLSNRSWPEPNLEMLNSALKQTGWDEESLRPSTWRQRVKQRLSAFDWPRAATDVEPFLESASAIQLVTLETASRLLESP